MPSGAPWSVPIAPPAAAPTWAAGRYRDAQVALGKKGLIVLGGGEHALVAYVALPNDWAPAKKGLPIVVPVDGAGLAALLAEQRKEWGAGEKLGFTNVTRRVMPGAGHANFPADGWKAFLPD